MLPLRDLRLVLCSLKVYILHMQRIIGFFIFITQKSTRLEYPITWIKHMYSVIWKYLVLGDP